MIHQSGRSYKVKLNKTDREIVNYKYSRQIDPAHFLAGEDEKYKMFNWLLGNPSVVIDMYQQAALL